MEIKTVGIACDHAGYALKKFVIEYLESHQIPFKDYGTYSDMSCDYPDFAHALGNGIANGDVYPGIGICGSGEGMAITLNKHKGVRAALVWSPEIAQLTRQHNDATLLYFRVASSTIRQPRKHLTNSSRLNLRADVTSAAYRRSTCNILFTPTHFIGGYGSFAVSSLKLSTKPKPYETPFHLSLLVCSMPNRQCTGHVYIQRSLPHYYATAV